MAKSKLTKAKLTKANPLPEARLAPLTGSGNPPLETTYTQRQYTLQWNFGKSQCSFDTAKDVSDFIRDELAGIEAHCPNSLMSR